MSDPSAWEATAPRVLPGVVRFWFRSALELCERARHDLRRATSELTAQGWTSDEIETVVLQRLRLLPGPPASITAAELRRRGLTEHPNATAILTAGAVPGGEAEVVCRECVQPSAYRQRPAEARYAVLYPDPVDFSGSQLLRCQHCGTGVECCPR
jgi:hypothetical protein